MARAGLQHTRSELRDARQVRSRGALVSALLALLVEKPFDAITIREISARAGTGYATFFRHYPTKEALLGDIAVDQLTRLLELAAPALYDRSDSLDAARRLCAEVDGNRPLWSALLAGGAAGIVREEFLRLAHALPRTDELVHGWLPSELGVAHGTGGTIDLLAWWMRQEPGRYPPQEVAALLDRLVVAPLVGQNADFGQRG